MSFVFVVAFCGAVLHRWVWARQRDLLYLGEYKKILRVTHTSHVTHRSLARGCLYIVFLMAFSLSVCLEFGSVVVWPPFFIVSVFISLYLSFIFYLFLRFFLYVRVILENAKTIPKSCTAPMSRCPNVSMSQLPSVPMSNCPNDPMSQWPHVPMS